MDKWKESLSQRVRDEGEVLDPLVKKRIEEAIEVGARWLSGQAATHPESVGLCLEFISKHIVHRTRLLVSGKSPETEKTLSVIFFLSERLEKKGINISKISIEILEVLTKNCQKEKKSFRQLSKTKKK